ncbi:hypothetical protein OIDMADRAFT_55814 [Oidiodendron maius Zn]|uniref:WSC domain-containing protein n=1 Tax=Oidiodendron maius (strain Zn) TaxID=913774 RepID=A0A0C3CLM9_OIDMZ|nr:hypothetical protein OIDMADRAFT_55814 [Oidiodendron maius Zn]
MGSFVMSIHLSFLLLFPFCAALHSYPTHRDAQPTVLKRLDDIIAATEARIAAFYGNNILNRAAAEVISSYSYLGCYDDAETRILDAYRTTAADLSPELCLAICQSQSYSIFGVEFATECYCGSTVSSLAPKNPEAACGSLCPGNTAFFCGDYLKINVFSATAPASSVGSMNVPETTTITTTALTFPTSVLNVLSTPSSSVTSTQSIQATKKVVFTRGNIAGIAIGSAAGAILICIAIFALGRHLRRREVPHVAISDLGQPLDKPELSSERPNRVYEMSGTEQFAVELGS